MAGDRSGSGVAAAGGPNGQDRPRAEAGSCRRSRGGSGPSRQDAPLRAAGAGRPPGEGAPKDRRRHDEAEAQGRDRADRAHRVAESDDHRRAGRSVRLPAHLGVRRAPGALHQRAAAPAAAPAGSRPDTRRARKSWRLHLGRRARAAALHAARDPADALLAAGHAVHSPRFDDWRARRGVRAVERVARRRRP